MRMSPRIPALAVAGVLAAASLTACGGDSTSASGDKNDSVKIMVGGLDKVIYLPAMLTERLGYFKDEGVAVQLLTEPAGVQAETALVSGDVQGTVGFYDHTLDLQVKGKQVESVVQLSQAPGEVEIVSNEAADDIGSAKDFKGKKLGVTGLGSSTDFLTKYLAVSNDVQTSDFTPVAVGAGQTFISALQQGSIHGGMTTDPTVATILDKKLGKILIDMRTPEGSKEALGGLYPSSSLYMQTEWVNGHKATVQKLANAFVKTLKWMSTHSAAEIAAKMPADYAQGGGAALYAQSIKNTLPMFTTDGVMPPDGPATVERVLKAFNPNLKNADVDLSKTYTTEFVKKAN
ncbi:ABC transporter substrate-binding protein [Streptomyces sp. NPDC050529]|uniref:ABC transporter substrate-binding protein n=1 Tax=unclassified Streptomyces TaxID=2593676 RepID=UPI002DD8301C|nr:ABC transporter substrate-binding protein [Streptomyces sp. NBC_01022]WRZ78996.1 ABC transporter substrate-binding protein [Streptomyces sp. NBC_01022]WRZ86683.1 ABC transporter substrate-binding protein [Streptomyces sp. NBC_01022]